MGRLFLPDYMPTSSLFRAIRLSGLLDHRSLLTPRCSDPSAARNPGTGGPREVPAPSSAIAAESRAPARLTPLLRTRKTASLWPWIGPAGRERTARRSMPPRKHTCPACLPGILAPPPWTALLLDMSASFRQGQTAAYVERPRLAPGPDRPIHHLSALICIAAEYHMQENYRPHS